MQGSSFPSITDPRLVACARFIEGEETIGLYDYLESIFSMGGSAVISELVVLHLIPVLWTPALRWSE